ncbi:MAG: hypothetical protein C5B44_06765 [Acidobacteria bacterium]|nr:MAG: hypothetical protein C5B44_06765 [Acidobacteriota bacterium]
MEAAKKKTLVETNAQTIFESFQELSASPVHRVRWIWELLQNACDACDPRRWVMARGCGLPGGWPIRLRNLLGIEPLRHIHDIEDFNIRVFNTVSSADGQFFAIEGIGGTDGTTFRKIMAIKSTSGESAWQNTSTDSLEWAANVFSSSGSQHAFTLDGKEYQTVD